MSRLSLEALESREVPAAHIDLYLNVWVNQGEVPAAAETRGRVDDLIGWDFQTGSSAHIRYRGFFLVDRTRAAGDVPLEEVSFTYQKIELQPAKDMALKGSKILQNAAGGACETLTVGGGRTAFTPDGRQLVVTIKDVPVAGDRDSIGIDMSAPRMGNRYAGSHALYQDVTIPAADGNTIYVGSANGGVWKTTDGGVSVALQRLANPTMPPAPSAVVFVGGWGSSMYQYG